MQDNKQDPYVKTWETTVNPGVSDEAIGLLKLVADRIISDTSYTFTHSQLGTVSEDPTDWNVDKIKLTSGYNDWKYWNGVIHMAMMEASGLLTNDRYKKYSADNYAFAFRHLDTFRNIYKAGVPDGNYHQFFRLDRLDDFGAMAAGLLELNDFQFTGMQTYIDRVSKYIAEQQDRLGDGTFCRRRFGITTLWADDLYMSVPFLVRLFASTGETQWLDDAIVQSENFHYRLFNETSGLYHHCWYEDTGQHGAAHWSRANGWVMMARVNLMNYLPQEHSYRDQLSKRILAQIVGLSRYQSASGLWRQLLDKPDSFQETSGTAMFTYGIARAVNQGWIPDYYASIALQAWRGLKEYISEKGEMDGVSLGFNIRQDLPYYYSRPLEPGGAHGIGALMFAAIEMSKLKPYRDCVWC